MKIKNIILLLVATSFLSSCLSYYDLKGISPRLDPATQEVYDNNVDGYRKGEACVTNILRLFAIGDSSIATAKKNGNISKISYVSTTYTHFIFYLPFFQKGCTVVYGQEIQS